MRKFGRLCSLACALGIAAVLAVPAQSNAKDSHRQRAWSRPFRSSHCYTARQRGTCRPRYGYCCPHGQKGYEHRRPYICYQPFPGHPVICRARSRRWNCWPWGQPGWGSFSSWEPGSSVVRNWW